jgi:hypothetical protein
MAVRARPAEENDWTALRRRTRHFVERCAGAQSAPLAAAPASACRTQPVILGNLALDAAQDDILINYAAGRQPPT